MGITLVVLVVLAGVALRFVTTVDLWLDEALSVHIARLPLSDLQGALEHDGAPPLYYVLLHFWIDVFGTGDVAVRALSGVISVATLPLAYLAGKRIGGRSVGWWSVLILAASPYAVRYGTETRMYALVMFLVLWGYLALRRALEAPRLGRLAVVAVITALLVYSLYWSFYLVAVVGIGLLVVWRRGSPPTRHAAPRVLLAMVVGGLALLPWLSTLVFQLQHTGTPWGDPITPWFGVALAFIGFVGGEKHSEAFVTLVPMILLPLLALFGAALDRRRIELDLRTRPAARLETGAAVAILVLGLTVSSIGGTAFDARYAAVMYPLLVLSAAYGLTAFADRRVRLGILAVVVGVMLATSARNVGEERTQAAQSADVIRAQARPRRPRRLLPGSARPQRESTPRRCAGAAADVPGRASPRAGRLGRLQGPHRGGGSDCVRASHAPRGRWLDDLVRELRRLPQRRGQVRERRGGLGRVPHT